MKILIIGGHGTIGKKVVARLSQNHQVIIGGRASGDLTVDITSSSSILAMFEKTGKIDSIICTAGTGYYGPFYGMTEDHIMPGINGKLLGQINLVLLGKDYLNPEGSITLTTGIAAVHPARNGAAVAMINGAINSFVLAASQELKNDQRINAVSPGLVEDSKDRYGAFFPGYNLVPMEKLVNAYILSVEGSVNGKILKVYS
ncbi:NAD(P)-dependent dehydrogenase, short-chain alcohol dehydrogenase family [Mucilaginibacter gossypiicola]|uniref:NAD(P)-dependent dehydrogenase, short-chain alcohol dehydrogenase family n=1 Tax=Mucilaginibacter gossypiicola TaxID=551995 RepID=A0A1H8CZX9_9SPHI|nr:short chain dehydrogenase [Mucilaginibacter gossypiicola]SEN00522.1 NAD(P)-dependent dehydrogenase, short-chain alcohol dehydrogenase family [Mucilaginibacter gossypiicola]